MKTITKLLGTLLTAASLAAAVNVSALAAPVPRESAPMNADEGAITVTENLIGGILDEVSGGLGFQMANGRANTIIRKAVIDGATEGYGYALLSAVSRNAIYQTRDMYLRADYYTAVEEEVKVLIADIITDVQNGKPYNEAVKEAYIAIYTAKDAAFDPADYEGIDTCYWPDKPAVDSVYLNRARKLLLEAK